MDASVHKERGRRLSRRTKDDADAKLEHSAKREPPTKALNPVYDVPSERSTTQLSHTDMELRAHLSALKKESKEGVITEQEYKALKKKALKARAKRHKAEKRRRAEQGSELDEPHIVHI